jgi:Xaa-Pro aminopeptidase
MLNRRDFVRSTSLLLPVALQPSLEARQQTPPVSGLLPNLPTGFSTAERDWRWKRVRTAMQQQKFDCLLTPSASGEAGADSRYLTQRGGWVVFPLDGAVIAVTEDGDGGRGGGGHWADQVLSSDRGRWSRGIIEALTKASVTRGRIGVGRLDGVLRNHEGEVSFTTLDLVKRALPGATFASAADLLTRVKLVHSDEELHAMAPATAAGERGIEAMIRTARPGVVHRDVWLAVFDAMTGATGETPSRLALRAGDEANTSGGEPLSETIQAGQILNQEIAARVLGYMAQVNQSICVGRPEPADWNDAAKYCLETYHELVDWIRPGKRYIDLCEHYARKARARSPELEPSWVLIHSCGLGDGPRMGAGRTETLDLELEPTMCFDIKPRILVKGTKPTVQFGDPVVVTATGARRLGTRPLEPLVVG